jgi:hypothetical protein
MSLGTYVNIEVFLGVTCCYYHFGGASGLYIEGLLMDNVAPEDGGSKLLQNIGKYLCNHVVSDSRRQSSEHWYENFNSDN